MSPLVRVARAVREGCAAVDYLADEGIAGVVFLADRLGKPVLVEGPAGTGKTQLAKSVAEMAGAPADPPAVLRGPRRVQGPLRVELQEAAAAHPGPAQRRVGVDWTDLEEDIFSEEFLLTRPLLEAIRADEPVVLLIDEVDRVEVETEALLLEILSDYQVSIPELGTVHATQIPLVFLTSNNTRELSEALKRRCLFLHIDYPDLAREKEIVLTRVPGISARPGRADRPDRALGSQPGAEEGAVGVRDPRLGPHPGAARHQRHRRRDRRRRR